MGERDSLPVLILNFSELCLSYAGVFNRIPKPSHPHASLLKVMKFYVVLDTSSSPPSSLKLVMVSIRAMLLNSSNERACVHEINIFIYLRQM